MDAAKAQRVKRIAVAGLVLLGTGLAVLVLAGGLAWAYVASRLPSADDLASRAIRFQTTTIRDREGGLLYEVIDPEGGRRRVVGLDQVSPLLVQATVATEDANFYEHHGVDPVAIARALYYAVREQEVVSGASTIPQQLARRIFLSPERTVRRKVREAVLAAEMSRRYEKDELLALYLNEIYYGNYSYGVEAAARSYFGKPPSALTLSEAALLAGLPQAPAYWDPYLYPDRALRRREIVLGLMAEQGMISEAEAEAAAAAPLTLVPPAEVDLRAPHFTLYVREQLEARFGPEAVTSLGLDVTTTLEPAMQAAAERAISETVASLAGRDVSSGALVAMDPSRGEVLAMVGSADYYDEDIEGQVNLALAPRQPGSTMKPLVYLAALEGAGRLGGQRWTPEWMIPDIEQEFPGGPGGPYVPRNYDEREHGIVTLRGALANSYNIPAIRAGQAVGVDAMRETATRMGISTLTGRDYGLSLALGSGEVPLLEMTAAYGALANGGLLATTNVLLRVTDAAGTVLCEQGGELPCALGEGSADAEPRRVASAVDAYLLTHILSDGEARVPAFGAGSNLEIGRPAAVKTGTTDDYRDSWTIGYTPDLVAGAWLGNADRRPMAEVPGSLGGGAAWNRFMRAVTADREAREFSPPEGVERIEVCADTGTRPSEACPDRRLRPFAADNPPPGPEADLWQRVAIDRESGRLAGERTPACLVEEKPFKVYPEPYRDWAREHGIEQPPGERDERYDRETLLLLDGPREGDVVAGEVTVTGRVDGPALRRYSFWVGEGEAPAAFLGPLAGPFDAPAEGRLAVVDLSDLPAGPYTLKLLAEDVCGDDVEARVRLRVENPTPTPTATATATAPASPTATSSSTPPPSATTPFASPTPLPPRPTDPGPPATLAPRPTLPPPAVPTDEPPPPATEPPAVKPTAPPGEPTLAPRPTLPGP